VEELGEMGSRQRSVLIVLVQGSNKWTSQFSLLESPKS